MKKIGLVGQKGGVGKTTTTHILVNAILSQSDDTSLLVIDCDPQQSTAGYHRNATARFPELAERYQCVSCSDEITLDNFLRSAEKIGFEYVIIDSPGQHATMSKYIMGAVDKIVIPVFADNDSYTAQLATIALYEECAAELTAKGETIAPMKLVLANWDDKEKPTLEQLEMIRIIQENPHLADWFIPYRRYYKNLSRGYIMHLDLRAQHLEKNTLMRNVRLEDIALSRQVLKDIEGIQ